MHSESPGTITDDIAWRGPASGAEAEEPLATVRLDDRHRTGDFRCQRSERVTRFLHETAPRWVKLRYCGVYVLADPEDATRVWGYYTLSQYVLSRAEMAKKHKDRSLVSNVPLALIGFMGKQDGAPTGVGAALITDAARRAYRSLDIPAWGLAVEPEGGEENARLWAWYKELRFIPAKTLPRLMYGPYENFMPEMTGAA